MKIGTLEKIQDYLDNVGSIPADRVRYVFGEFPDTAQTDLEIVENDKIYRLGWDGQHLCIGVTGRFHPHDFNVLLFLVQEYMEEET